MWGFQAQLGRGKADKTTSSIPPDQDKDTVRKLSQQTENLLAVISLLQNQFEAVKRDVKGIKENVAKLGPGDEERGDGESKKQVHSATKPLVLKPEASTSLVSLTDSTDPPVTGKYTQLRTICRDGRVELMQGKSQSETQVVESGLPEPVFRFGQSTGSFKEGVPYIFGANSDQKKGSGDEKTYRRAEVSPSTQQNSSEIKNGAKMKKKDMKQGINSEPTSVHGNSCRQSEHKTENVFDELINLKNEFQEWRVTSTLIPAELRLGMRNLASAQKEQDHKMDEMRRFLNLQTQTFIGQQKLLLDEMKSLSEKQSSFSDDLRSLEERMSSHQGWNDQEELLQGMYQQNEDICEVMTYVGKQIKELKKLVLLKDKSSEYQFHAAGSVRGNSRSSYGLRKKIGCEQREDDLDDVLEDTDYDSDEYQPQTQEKMGSPDQSRCSVNPSLAEPAFNILKSTTPTTTSTSSSFAGFSFKSNHVKKDTPSQFFGSPLLIKSSTSATQSLVFPPASTKPAVSTTQSPLLGFSPNKTTKSSSNFVSSQAFQITKTMTPATTTTASTFAGFSFKPTPAKKDTPSLFGKPVCSLMKSSTSATQSLASRPASTKPVLSTTQSKLPGFSLNKATVTSSSLASSQSFQIPRTMIPATTSSVSSPLAGFSFQTTSVKKDTTSQSCGSPVSPLMKFSTSATQSLASHPTSTKPVVNTTQSLLPGFFLNKTTETSLSSGCSETFQIPKSTTPVTTSSTSLPFAGFSFNKTSGTSSSVAFSQTFQIPKSATPVTTTSVSSPFPGFSFKTTPSKKDTPSLFGSSSSSQSSKESSAAQQYPQLTALLSGDLNEREERNVESPRPGFSAPSQSCEAFQKKLGQSPMGVTSSTSQQKDEKLPTTPLKSNDDDDVIFMGECKATPEQVAKAEKLMLPSNFYLYEQRPPCPGCRGCDEEDLKAKKEDNKHVAVEQKSSSLFQEKPKEPASQPPSFFSNAAISSLSFASLSADGDAGFAKKDPSKPFPQFPGAGAQVFGSPSTPQQVEESVKEDQEYDPHYDPIISLPENVDLTTGDEGQEVVFKERAKLYRYDSETQEWKECGVGDVKILKDPETGRTRILMRRKQVLKVCANHWLTPNMELLPMSSSDRAWVWNAVDFAEGEECHEQFAIKFKTPYLAAEFKKTFDKMKEEAGPSFAKPVESVKEKPVEPVKEKPAEPVEEKPATITEGDSGLRFHQADPGVAHPQKKYSEKSGGAFSLGNIKFSGFSFKPSAVSPGSGFVAGDVKAKPPSFFFGKTPSQLSNTTPFTSASSVSAGSGFGGGDVKAKPPSFFFGKTPSQLSNTTPVTSASAVSAGSGFGGGDVKATPPSFFFGQSPSQSSNTTPYTSASAVSAGSGFGGGDVKATPPSFFFGQTPSQSSNTTPFTSASAVSAGSGFGGGDVKATPPSFFFGQTPSQSSNTTPFTSTSAVSAGSGFGGGDVKAAPPSFFFGQTPSQSSNTTPFTSASAVSAGSGFGGGDVKATTPSFFFGQTPSQSSNTTPFTRTGFNVPPESFSFTHPRAETSQPAEIGGFKMPSSSFFFAPPTPNSEPIKSTANSTTKEPPQFKPTEAAPRQQAITTPKFNFGSGPSQFTFGSANQQKPKFECSFGSTSGSISPTSLAASTSSSSSTTQPRSNFGTSQATPLLGATQEKGSTSAFKGFELGTKPAETKTEQKEAISFSHLVKSQGALSFVLDLNNVASSPPNSRAKSPVKSPGLNKSGEYYQEEERDDIYFEPVVTLPENYKVETGEENEEVKFSQRAKLYRFDVEGSQWKERGVGDIKVLYNPETKQHRIVMRREQVLKVCANHYITQHVNLQPNKGSERSWVWQAMDSSDGDPQNEQLAIRFKTEEEAREFKEVVDEAKKNLPGSSDQPVKPVGNAETKKKPVPAKSDKTKEGDVTREMDEDEVKDLSAEGEAKADEESSTGKEECKETIEEPLELTQDGRRKGKDEVEEAGKDEETLEKKKEGKSMKEEKETSPASPENIKDEDVVKEKETASLLAKDKNSGGKMPLKPADEETAEEKGKREDTIREIKFSAPADLFYEDENKDWNPRGRGKFQILFDKEKKHYLVEMERDKDNTLCAQHPITKAIQLVPVRGSDRSYAWSAKDSSNKESTPVSRVFSVRFKDRETAGKFQEEFQKAQTPVVEASPAGMGKDKDK